MRVRVEPGRLIEVSDTIYVGGQTLEVSVDQARALLRSGAVRRVRERRRRRAV
jgi:hypothetical protein